MDVPLTGADVVIVGGGMSGLSVAAELAQRSDVSVVVLEAGPDAGHAHVREAFGGDDALRLWLSPDTDPHFWRPYETDGPHYLGLSGLRRRVGGRSLYWGGALLPIEDWALDGAWPAAIVADLVESWDGGPSLYARVAAEIEAWVEAGPDTRPGELVMAGAVFQPTPTAVRASGGRSAAYSPLEKIGAEGRPPVIVPHCHILGVTTAGGRATGVRVRLNGGETQVSATRVVLAAGTIENSRLAIQALSGLGCLDGFQLTGLVDKISHGFTFSFLLECVQPALRRAAVLGTTFYRPLGATLRSNHFVRLWIRPDGAAAFDTWLMGEQERGDAGAVRCVPSERWPWSTHVAATLGMSDETLCVAQRDHLSRFWEEIRGLFAMPDSMLSFDEGFGSPDLRERLLTAHAGTLLPAPLTYSFPLGSEQHEAGTTPLGIMLDDAHTFKAVPGLSAAGPSSFPRTGAANPAMTILALGQRLAATLAVS